MNSAAGQTWRDLYFTSQDGLRLYARHYPASHTQYPPVLCLPGLTRNTRDFHDFALALSRNEGAPDIYALDSRGRGLSESDPDPKNYAIPVEAQDALDFMTAFGLSSASIVGTSRGGLVAMAMAVIRPNAIRCVVLNDIGPVIEQDGLLRIAAYAGRVPLPQTWQEATDLVASMSRRAFPAVPEKQWAEVARQWFNEADGKPAPGYDPAIARSISVTNGPMQPIWPQFAALSNVPVLIVRGERSDILSGATMEEMQRRHPRCASFVVPGQGHAPLLKDTETIGVIANFLVMAGTANSSSQTRLR